MSQPIRINIFPTGSDIDCLTGFMTGVGEVASAMLWIELIQAPLEDIINVFTFGLFGAAHDVQRAQIKTFIADADA